MCVSLTSLQYMGRYVRQSDKPQPYHALYAGAHHHTHHTCTQGTGNEKGELKACLPAAEVEAVAIGASKALEGELCVST